MYWPFRVPVADPICADPITGHPRDGGFDHVVWYCKHFESERREAAPDLPAGDSSMTCAD